MSEEIIIVNKKERDGMSAMAIQLGEYIKEVIKNGNNNPYQ